MDLATVRDALKWPALRVWFAELRANGAWALTGLTVLPILVIALGMKLSRVLLLPEQVTLARRVVCLLPDALYWLSFVALAIVLLDQARARWQRLGLIVVQLLALLTFAVDALAFGYYKATGLVLDYMMVSFSLSRVSETAPVVGSEITAPTAALLLLIPLWLLIAPWVWHVWRFKPSTQASVLPKRWRFSLAAAGTSILALGLSQLISVKDVPVSFARDPVVHLVRGMLQTLDAVDTGEAPPPRRTGPRKVEVTDATKKHNVVVIVLESTRADATTAYKPKLATTPFLAELAKEATRVERAYAIVPHTSKALVAILCGVEPRPSLEIVEAADKGMPARCLAKLLSGVGYDTAYFQAPKGSFEQREQLVKNMGYRTFRASESMSKTGFTEVNYFGYEDAIMLKPSEDWLKHKAREPFLATYLTSASHHPYGVPPSYVPQAFSRGRNNKYLNAVSYVDSVVKRIVDQYKAAGLYERTIFVVVGDHGEAFNEHRLATHDDVVYEEGLRVPLIVRAPGRTDLPRVVKGPLSQLDIVPTILSLLGLRTVGGKYQGQPIYTDRGSTPLFAACYRNAQCLATIRGDMKLLYFFDDKPTLLFNLKRDPRERKNIAAEHPDLVRQWTDDLKRWTLAVEEAHRANSLATVATFVRHEAPKLAKPLNVSAVDLFDVLGCTAMRRKRATIEVTCHYRVRKRLDDTVRIRVRGSVGDNAKVFDHRAVRGLYPLRDWQVDEYITDRFDVRAPLDWERQNVDLCVMVERNKVSAKLSPAPAAGDNCIPFATVPARVAPAKATKAPATP